MTVLEKDVSLVLSDESIPWKDLSDSNVLVTGATGLVGSLIVKVLQGLDQNIKIIALVRNIEKADRVLDGDINYIKGDIREPIEIDEKIDYIFHCASVTTSKYMVSNPVETLAISIEGTKNILELAKHKDIKSMIYLSSMEVYGIFEHKETLISEDELGYLSLNEPRSSYPAGKRMSELLCNVYCYQYGTPVKVARLAQTFGPGIPLTDNRVFMQFARSAKALNNIVLHTRGTSMNNFCYITDVLRGLFTILLKGESGQAYNVSNESESRTIREVAELVANDVAGGKIDVIYDIPETNIHGYAPESSRILSSSKLRKLGWDAQVNMKDAYSRLLAYLSEQF